MASKHMEQLLEQIEYLNFNLGRIADALEVQVLNQGGPLNQGDATLQTMQQILSGETILAEVAKATVEDSEDQ